MRSARRSRQLLAVLVVGAALVSTSCGAEDDSADGVSAAESGEGAQGEATSAPILETTDPLDLDPEASLIVADIEAATSKLLESPAVEVVYIADNVDGGSAEGHAQIDNTTGNFTSSAELTSDVNRDVRVVSELVLVDDEIFSRIFNSADVADEVAWQRSEPGDLRDQFVDEVYTAGGAAGASLERMLLLLNGVPWTLEASAKTDVDGVLVRSHLVRFGAADISGFLRDENLELIGPVDPEGATLFEFWIDADEGVLVKVLAGGTQFQDGEALPDARIEIAYERLDALQIIAPDNVEAAP